MKGKGELLLHRERLVREQKRWKRWQKAVSVMAAMVVFCTAYALILPAVTMGAKTYCGMEEHQHGEECFVLLRKGAATPGDAYVVTPEEAMKASGSNAVGSPATPDDQNPGETDEDRIPATPGDAQTREEDYELATPGNAEEDRPEGPAGEETEDVPESGNPENLEDSEGTQPENVREGNSEDESLDLSGDYEAENSGYTQDEGSVDLATPGNAKAVSTASRKGDKKVVEEDDEEELATPGNASLVKVTTSQKSKTHSASNAYEEDDEEYDPEDDLEEYDEPFDEDIELINDLETEPEEEKEELEADWIPYEPGMDYDEDIYELIAICGMEEHTHSLACYSDPEADVETEEDWLRTIPQLTGKLPEDIVAVADSQVEYRESEKNYQVEGVDTIKGYTRYGQWYGEPYENWDGMFASFCIYYAGGTDAPIDADCNALADKLMNTMPGLYRETGEYEPQPGDLIFLSGGDEETDHVGIVKEVTEDEAGKADRVVAIEGDFNNKVGYQTYDIDSPEIQGYGLMSRYGINLLTIQSETENAVITAVYEEGALPEQVQLYAVEMPEDDARAAQMRVKLEEQGLSQGKVLTAMIPFDITFLDEEGEKVEPSGLIQITAEFKKPIVNETVEPESEESREGAENASGEDEEDGSDEEILNQEAGDRTDREKDMPEQETEEPEEVKESAGDEESLQTEETEEAGDREETEQNTDSQTDESAETDREEKNPSEEGESTDGEAGLEEGERLSLSAKVVTRVGTGNGNEGKSTADTGLTEDSDARQKETGEKGEPQAEPEWELYHMPEGGEPEKLSESENLKIEADEENALHEVTFQSQSSLQWAAVAYAARTGTECEVSTYSGLVNAIAGGSGSTLTIKLTGDIEVTEEEIPKTDEEKLPDAAVVIKGKDKNITLDLNGCSLSLGTIKTPVEYNLIGVYEGACLRIVDSRDTSPREPVEKETLQGLHYDDAGEHISQDYYENQENDPWKLAKKAVYGKQGGNRYLEYYVTDVEVIDEEKGKTRETLKKYRIENPGIITTGDCGEEKHGRGVYVHDSTLILESGAIAGCSNQGIFSDGTSTVELKGGYVCGNTVTTGAWGGGIRLDGNTNAILSGTVISGNNDSACGGGINVCGSTVFNMTGGYVTNNRAGSQGGGIRIEVSASAYLAGGYITNNLANRSGGIFKDGKGQFIIGKSKEEYQDENNRNKDSSYTIYISRNLANTDEGGGCVVEGWAGVEIYKGYITNNRTNTDQHWGGGGLFIADGSKGYVENILVTGNTAGGFGGGVTGCPTSRIYISMEPGMAIYDNTAGDPNTIIEDETVPNKVKHLSGSASVKSQDHNYSYKNKVFMRVDGQGRPYYNDFYCALTCEIDCRMLGGSMANWVGSADGVPVEGTGDRLVCVYNMGLNSKPTETGRNAAQRAARLYINGNSSWTHAGGILCNGYMVAGAVENITVADRMVIEAKKSLIKEDGQEMGQDEWDPEKYHFEFEIFDAKGTSYGTFNNDKTGEINFNVMLGAAVEGDHVFYVRENNTGSNGAILMDSTVYRLTLHLGKEELTTEIGNLTVNKCRYKIEDVKVARRFDGKIEEDGKWEEMTADWDRNDAEQSHDTLYLGGRNKAAFTNKLRNSIGFTVIKEWADGKPADEHQGVEIQLLKNGEKYMAEGCMNPVTLGPGNSWEYTWENLPADGSYSVEELNVPPGYRPNITVEQKAGCWVPISENAVITPGKQYAIVNQAGDIALAIQPDHHDFDINGTTGDVENVEKGKGEIFLNGIRYDDWYPGDTFGERSIFTPVVPGSYANPDDGITYEHKENGKYLLQTSGLTETNDGRTNTWLAAEQHNSNTNTFKTVGWTQWASYFWFENGKLVSDTMRWWDTNQEARVMVYKGDKSFDTIEKTNNPVNTAKVYVFEPTADKAIVTITNVPEKDVLYKLNIKKISGAGMDSVLPGAKFALWKKDGSKALQFNHTNRGYGYYAEGSLQQPTELTTELATDNLGVLALYDLPAGDYILKETSAPSGYIAVEDMPISLTSGDDLIREIQITDPLYELPKTGGHGIYWYTLGGMFLMAGSLLWGYSSRRRRERRVIK